jgi:hypothetical protein
MSDHATMPAPGRRDRTRRFARTRHNETCTPTADLRRTTGYLVADRTGHLVGKVECAMYGTAPDVPDALSVKSRPLSRHRLLVPAAAIAEVDGASGVVGLCVDRRAIRRFL